MDINTAKAHAYNLIRSIESMQAQLANADKALQQLNNQIVAMETEAAKPVVTPPKTKKARK